MFKSESYILQKFKKKKDATMKGIMKAFTLCTSNEIKSPV